MKKKTQRKISSTLSLTKYQEYAKDVLEGKITACNYIKMACKRFLALFERDDMEFRAEEVDKCINFISHLKHFQGKHSGENFILQPWQVWVVSNIFGFYWKSSGKRVVRNVYIEMGRKNGKSALIAAIGLYAMICEEDGAEVDVAANSRQQAHILYDLARGFAEKLDTKKKYINSQRDHIYFKARRSFMQVMAAESKRLDGFNGSCIILDEAHEAKDSKLYDVLKSSQGMRENPLAIVITSAGFDMFGFCYQMRTTCVEILNGLKKQDDQFCAIYSCDDRDNWKEDKTCWIKSNPNLGVTVNEDFLEEQVQACKNNPSLEVSTGTKHFGVWFHSSDVWIPSDYLMSASKKIKIKDFKGCDYFGFIGIDLAAVSDLTAVSLMVPTDDKYYFKTWYFLPQSALKENGNAELYKQWQRQKYLEITSGNATDYDIILKKIKEISEIVLINKIGYDAWNSTQFVINAVAEGLPMEPFSQSIGNFNRPTKEFERLIRENKIIIDNNPITRYCFQNVAIKEDFNGNTKPVKGSGSMGKIDGVISILTALGIYVNEPYYNNEIG